MPLAYYWEEEVNTKHTPGPWRITARNVDASANWASRIPFAIELPYGASVLPIADVCDQPNAKANAELIAAAPDLLDALKHIYYSNEFGFLPDGIQSHAKAAIAKATGANQNG